MIFTMPPSDFVPQFSVATVVLLVGKQVLLIQHGETKKDAGCWGTIGGKKEKGDRTLRKTAQRETFEETGIKLGPRELISPPGFEKPDAVRYNDGRAFLFQSFGVIRNDRPTIRTNAREIQNIGWFTLEKALTLPLLEDAAHYLTHYVPHLLSR